MLYNQGVRSIIFTPHSSAFLYNGLKNIIYKYECIKRLIKNRYNDLNLYLGSEIFCYKENINNVLDELKHNIITPINDTKYLLIEFSNNFNIKSEMLYCVNVLYKNGWKPILAHAERYNIDDLTYRRVHDIAKIQINLYSISNEKDTDIKRRAKYLLDNDLVDIVGSDSHRVSHRPPVVVDGAKKLLEEYGENKVKRLLYYNAEEMFCS